MVDAFFVFHYQTKMKITILLKRTMLLVVMILTALYANAAYYGGTITIKVGETYFVNADFGGGLVQTGSWTKSNSTFIFVSRSSKSCTIRGEQVGTGTLYYTGYAGAYDADTYWTVNVVSSTPNSSLTLTATPAGGTVEKGTKVRLNASNESALITYTLDGSDPLTSSTSHTIPSDYPNAPVINESCTLKAYAEYINRSDVYTWTYTVKEDIAINSTNFPDINFRNYLLEQDYGKDGILTKEEIQRINGESVTNKNISNLKGIEYFTYLTVLWCGGNQLTSLDVSNNTKLSTLDCSANQLTTLDVSNTALATLQCMSNQLTTLDVSSVAQTLNLLHCERNQLVLLDVSKNTALKNLYCNSNQLTTLDVSKSTALTQLICNSNQLTELDVSKNTALTTLSCYNNMIKGVAMDALIAGLPKNTTDKEYIINVYRDQANDGNVCTKKQVAAIKAKGWTPKYYNGSEWVEYEGIDDGPVSITLPDKETVAVNGTIKLIPTIEPANAVTTTLTWTSDDETIATVDSDGVVKGMKVGQTFINVETENGKTAYCKLTVTTPEPAGITLPQNVTLCVGDTLTLTPTLIPENAETTLTWKSDDESVARISGNGVLTGVSEGLAIVTVSTANGLTSNACKVKVEFPSGINGVFTDERLNAPIYNVSGQRVVAPKKGIYIVNGKKIVVK